jgi:hypothetical protein
LEILKLTFFGVVSVSKINFILEIFIFTFFFSKPNNNQKMASTIKELKAQKNQITNILMAMYKVMCLIEDSELKLENGFEKMREELQNKQTILENKIQVAKSALFEFYQTKAASEMFEKASRNIDINSLDTLNSYVQANRNRCSVVRSLIKNHLTEHPISGIQVNVTDKSSAGVLIDFPETCQARQLSIVIMYGCFEFLLSIRSDADDNSELVQKYHDVTHFDTLEEVHDEILWIMQFKLKADHTTTTTTANSNKSAEKETKTEKKKNQQQQPQAQQTQQKQDEKIKTRLTSCQRRREKRRNQKSNQK